MPRISPAASTVTIELDGDQLQAREGEPVACAVIANDELIFGRSPKYHRPRGPFCLTGACSQCLMRVDGIPNVATCRVAVKPGMRLERQNALPDGKLDLLRANDFVFSDWFNHHEFLAGWPLADQVLLKIARQLSGLGILPERDAAQREPAIVERHPLVIVGGGAAGLAAAKELSARGVEYVLFEREAQVGGRLLSGAEKGQPEVFAARARTNARVAGLFADDGAPFLAVLEAKRLHLVFFERILLAIGGNPFLPTFPNNDLPGVMAGRAVSTLIRRHDVLPGKTIACVGEPTEARALAERVTAAGGEAIAVGAEVVRAHGLRQVNAVTVNPGGKMDCDVIAVCGPMSPAFELARAAGAEISWNPKSRFFEVQADANGRTANPNVFVAGEMRGPMSAAAAAEQGLAAATALARPLPDPLPRGGEGERRAEGSS